MTAATQSGEGGQHLRRDIGRIGLLFTGVGSIIGSGWLFASLSASQIAGPAAIFAWVIAAVMIMLIGLTYSELGTMFPVAGGVIRFPHYAFGGFASFTMGWITWLAAAVVAPVEVQAVLTYATKYANFTTPHSNGAHTLTALGFIVAILLLALFCVINIAGVRFFARFNNVVVWWKLFVVVLAIVAVVVTVFHSGNFNNPHYGGFAYDGLHGVFAAIATAGITFSFLGFRQGIELAGETDNPKRNVPFAVIGSIGICALIYIALQIVFIGAIRPSDLLHSGGWEHLAYTNDFSPLASIAAIIGLGWLATILYIDAIVSPADTGLIYTTVTSRLGYVLGRNGTSPSFFARLTGRGVPWIATVLAFVVGIIFMLPFPSWQQLIGLVTSATVMSFGSGPLVWAAMRKELPDQNRPFRLWGSHVIPFLAFYSSMLIVYWTGWNTNWKFFVAIAIGLVLLGVFKVTGQISVPRMDFRHGYWTLVWLAGMAAISYLGDYDGGDAVFSGLPAGFLVNLGWAIVCYLLAYYSRLPGDRMRDIIENTPHDEVAVEEATG